jgi:hypothetical protein
MRAAQGEGLSDEAIDPGLRLDTRRHHRRRLQ